MNSFRKSSFRFLAAVLLMGVFGLAGCSSTKYTAAPSSENLTYMGLKFEKTLYGGPWYGPKYTAPRVVVAPTLANGE
ncbi:MAG: hypothetical protein ACKVI3_15160 [Verrucomicrobiia bacterium]|tara:strand:+ start:633 stop:863 length:231 start_codon:yes stop_codon:yes gene_type:complete